jgi:stage V sporulation protein D (sporulation-specific penicillin-binding protein)
MAIAFIFLLIFCRLFYIQIIWGNELQIKAIDQWTRELPIIAERGLIADTNGIVLASNKSTYSVFVRPRAVDNVEEVAERLANIFSLNYETILKKIKNKNTSEVTIIKQANKELIAELNNYEMSGVYYSRDNSRVYTYGNMLSQVIGFTSIDGTGQTGLEAYYNKYLKGLDGEILYEADLLGIELEDSSAEYVPATDGLNIKLTIDIDIQMAAEAAMEQAYINHSPKSAQAIVMDPSTGAILAMSNYPGFDLNDIPRDDIDLLNTLSRNSIVVDIFEPGSTFKVLTAAANIEEYLQGNVNAFSLEHVFSNSPTRIVDGQKIKCWSDHKNGKHSNQNLAMALNNSCNPIFVDIALALGKEKMYEYIQKFNYGTVTGIDFTGEAQGMVLNEAMVKNCDLARIGFGQTIAVTGLQLAAATAAAVNGGVYYQPYFVKEIFSNSGEVAEMINPLAKNRVISKEASTLLSSMLEGVVRDGSGKRAYIEGYKVGGKTGTAQKYQNGVIANGKYVSSFVGYFPANNPKYLCLVLIDEPIGQYYGSIVAAPYAKQIFEGIISSKNIQPYE